MIGAALFYVIACLGYVAQGQYWMALVVFCYIAATVGLYMGIYIHESICPV